MNAKPPADRLVSRPGTRVPGARWRARTATATRLRVRVSRGCARRSVAGGVTWSASTTRCAIRSPGWTTAAQTGRTAQPTGLPSALRERDLDRLAVGGILDLEELAPREPERACQEAVREH